MAESEPLLIIEVPEDTMSFGVDWSPDGALLASVDGKSNVKVWCSNSGVLVYVLSMPLGKQAQATRVAWSPDGSKIAGFDANGPEFKLWDAGSGKELHTLREPTNVRSAAWSLDGVGLATAGYASPGARVWDASGGSEIHTLGDTDLVCGLAWGLGGAGLQVIHAGGVQIWDVSSREVIHEFRSTQATSQLKDNMRVALSPDEQKLAIANEENPFIGTVRVIDFLSGEEIYAFPCVTGQNRAAVRGLKWSPYGNMLAVLNGSKNFRVWGGERAKEIRVLKRSGGWINHVAWSPDGSKLASCSQREVVVWDPRDGSVLQVFRGGHPPQGGVEQIFWSPDGTMLASCGWDIRIWSVCK